MKSLFGTKASANRLSIALALVAILFAAGNGCAAESGAKEFNYDPASCKTDAHGKLYIALGRNVLGVPRTGAVLWRATAMTGLSRSTQRTPWDAPTILNN